MPTLRRTWVALAAVTWIGCGSDSRVAPVAPDASGEPPADAAKRTTKDASDAAPAVWAPSSTDPIHYHWQLSTAFSAPRDVLPGDGPTVYDLDGETNDAATVAALHALGPSVKVVCYVDVGTWESYRSDASKFPASVIGNPNGWPGEKWLDVRQQSLLLPLMKSRFENWCVAKGFDAVEPDNLDGWENDPGFPVTETENLSYDLAIAAMGHALNLSMGLKNLPENAPSLEPHFDWALNEQCFEFGECSYFEKSFIAKGKAVWDVEYNPSPDCASASDAHLNAQKRDLDLVGPKEKGFVYAPCVADSQSTW